jgi:hypothetical protein
VAEAVDLGLCGISADGTPIYGSPTEAGAFQLTGLGVWLILKYPRETLTSLTLAAIFGMCLYLARDAIRFAR